MSEQKYKLGAIPSPIDLRDYKIAKAIDESQFPDEFEISMPHVKNQMQVSSCVAHALSEVVEYFNSQQEDSNKVMSTGYIYGNRTNMTHKGEGMVIRDALSNLQKYGDVTADEFPWNIEVPEAIEAYEKAKSKLKDTAYPNRISQYYRVNNKAEIKQALVNDGPVVFSIEWYDDICLSKYEEILTQAIHKRENGYHCMVIYGWCEKGWKILNSWGKSWGDGGKAILPYTVPLSESWGVIDTIIDNTKREYLKSLEDKVAELACKNIELEKQISSLLDSLENLTKKLADKEALTTEQTEELNSLISQLNALRDQSAQYVEQIESYKKEIAKLNEELTQLKKPYSSKLGSFLMKTVNFIIAGYQTIRDQFKKN